MTQIPFLDWSPSFDDLGRRHEAPGRDRQATRVLVNPTLWTGTR